jgi:hypothetical protein
MAWELATKEDVMSLHPVLEAELRDEWSDFAEGLVKQHMGQPYLGTSQVITDEYHDGDGSNILRPKNPPIISVQSLYMSDSLLSADEYVVFNTHLELKYKTFPRSVLNVKINYTSGKLVVDEITRLTTAAMIVAIVNYRKRYGSDASLKWSTLDQKGGEDDGNENFGLMSHLQGIMKTTLRRPRLRVK